jgi:hypothetical protein
MSAKLLKSLASGKCTIRNSISSEVSICWVGDRNKFQTYVIRPGQVVDMLQFATIAQLRKSPNLKELFNKGFLKIDE